MRFPIILAMTLTVSVLAVDAFAQDCGATADGETDPQNSCRVCAQGTWHFLPEYTVCEPEMTRCFAGPSGEGVYRTQCVPTGAADQTTCEDVFKTTCPNGFACTADGSCGSMCASDADCAGERTCVDNACSNPVDPGPDAGSTDAGAGSDAGSDAGSSSEPDAGSVSSDAGTAADLGNTRHDGGSAGESDAGTTDEKSGCVTAGSGGPSPSSILLGIVVAAGANRRRKRSS